MEEHHHQETLEETGATVMVFAFSAVMFIGAFLAGYIPLSINISQSRYDDLSSF
jgi:hypothetical protein